MDFNAEQAPPAPNLFRLPPGFFPPDLPLTPEQVNHLLQYYHVAQQHGIDFKGMYASHQWGLFLYYMLNLMCWDYVNASRGGGSILALICRDTRVTAIVPRLLNLLHEDGAKKFGNNIPNELKLFIPPKLLKILRENANYKPPVMAEAVLMNGAIVPIVLPELRTSSSGDRTDMSVDRTDMSVTSRSTHGTANTVTGMVANMNINLNCPEAGPSAAAAASSAPVFGIRTPRAGSAPALLQARGSRIARSASDRSARTGTPSLVLSGTQAAKRQRRAGGDDDDETKAPPFPDFYEEDVSQGLVELHRGTSFDVLKSFMKVLTVTSTGQLLGISEDGRPSIEQGLAKVDRENLNRHFNLIGLNPDSDGIKMIVREYVGEGEKNMPAIEAQSAVFMKQCEFSDSVLVHGMSKIKSEQHDDYLKTKELVNQLLAQYNEREKQRTGQMNQKKKDLTYVRGQKEFAKEVSAEVSNAAKRLSLVKRATNCLSRDPLDTTWRGIAIQSLDHFDIEDKLKNEHYPAKIVEEHNAATFAEQEAEMRAGTKNFVGKVVDVNDALADGMTAITEPTFQSGTVKDEDDDDAMAAAAAAKKAVDEDSKMQAVASPAGVKADDPFVDAKPPAAADAWNRKSPPEEMARGPKPAAASSGKSVDYSLGSLLGNNDDLSFYLGTSAVSASGGTAQAPRAPLVEDASEDGFSDKAPQQYADVNNGQWLEPIEEN